MLQIEPEFNDRVIEFWWETFGNHRQCPRWPAGRDERGPLLTEETQAGQARLGPSHHQGFRPLSAL